MRIYCIRWFKEEGGSVFVFVCFTLFMNRLKLIDCTNFTIFKMTPISTHGKLTKERLVNLVVRRGECFVGLLLVYG